MCTSFQNFEYYNFSWGKSFSPVKLFSHLLVLLVSIQSSVRFHFMFRFMLQNFYPPPPSGSRKVLGFFKHFFYIFFQTTKSNYQRSIVFLLFSNPFIKLDTFLFKPYSNLDNDLKETLDIHLLSSYTISHIFISLSCVIKSRLSFLSSLSELIKKLIFYWFGQFLNIFGIFVRINWIFIWENFCESP